MPRVATKDGPTYTHHKASGQAVVRLDGRDIYLGPWNSAASREAYDRVKAEWLSAGRRLIPAPTDPEPITVAEIVSAFRKYAETSYKASREAENYADAYRPLLKLYGKTSAVEFGPLRLKAVRQSMIGDGLCRNVVNRRISRIKYIFSYAGENELIPEKVPNALKLVKGLRLGRSEARESDPVKPVPEHVLAETLPHLGNQVRAMVLLQLNTGMRPGELCSMRTCDIDTKGRVWIYKPATHKTAHHGHVREIRIGPKAQAILAPFLKTDLQAFIFSPADAEIERHQQQRENRKTKVQPSQIARADRAKQRQRSRSPRDRWDTKSYRRAIDRACDKADARAHEESGAPADDRIIRSWHPHMLRHNFATSIRRDYGPEAALVLLGDKTTRMVDVYAEKDRKTAEQIIAVVG